MLRWLALRLRYSARAVEIDNTRHIALVADTWLKRAFGLIYMPLPLSRLDVKPSCMLFIYPKSGRHSIWMAGMKCPLDVLWLGKDKKVVDYAFNLKPSSFFNSIEYLPESDALYVLEFPVGTLDHVPKLIAF